MSERCKHVEKNGFNCGSYAFNLYKDGIDQGKLCDVHYWQAKAQRTWVGLTDEDCKGMSAGDKVVAMWADRTLKEKNT